MVEPDRRVTVVILYRHALFGEGIGHLLSTETDTVVACAPSDDPDAVAEALARDPDAVIFERGEPDMAVEILRYAPDALLIDVTMAPGPAFTWHREEIESRPDGIVGVIRGVCPSVRSSAPADPRASEASIAAGIRAVGGI